MKFRFHKLVADLNTANKQTVAELLTRAIQNSHDMRLPQSDRAVWKDLSVFLRKQLKRY